MGYRPHVLTTAGDLVDAASNGVYQRLPAGPNGQFLQVAGGVPAWQQPATFAPAGLSGATAASRYVGGTASGAPTSGTFAVGDFVVDQTGKAWVCTVAGTPGTWAQLAGGAGSSTLAGDTDVAIASPIGGQVLGYSSALSKWVNQNQAGVAATTQIAHLAADVTMTSVNTYYDGPSVTLSPGTWLLLGNVTAYDASGAAYITAKLWDGTTVYDSRETTVGAANWYISTPLSAIVSPATTTTYKISVADGTTTGGVIKATATQNAAGTNATTLTAIQLSGNPVGQQAPAVRAYNSGTVSLTNSTWTVVPLDTTAYDQGTSTAQHSTSSNTSRLVCQQSGVYDIGGAVQFSGKPADGQVRLYLNGTTVIGQHYESSPGLMEVEAQYRLAVGDYVEMYVWQASSVSVTGSGDIKPTLWMARIDSGPGAVQPNTKVQLDYALSSDVSILPSNTTWTDFVGNQTFNVDDPSSVIEIDVSGYIYNNGAANTDYAARVVIDSSGVPINKMISGGRTDSSGHANQLDGVGTVSLTGLSAGPHTVKLQVYGTFSGGNIACSVATTPNIYSLQIRVLERKQSVSPPSSTPAPAVRVKNSASQSVGTTMAALNFDTTELDQGTSSPQHSMSSNNSRLTCQQAGFYSILGTISWSGVISSEVDISVRLNGTTDIGYFQNAGGLYITIHQVSAMHYLNVGDYVEFYAVNNNALSATNYADASTTFAMVRCDTGGTGAVYVPQVKTSNYTCLPTDSMVVAGASGLTLTLPAASAYTGKPPLVIKNDPGFSASTIAAAGSDTIDGAATYALPSEKQSISLVSDALSHWRVI